MTKQEKIDQLLKQRTTLKTYLLAQFDAEDFHAVQDAASDLRDVDSMLDGLNYEE